MENNDSGLVWKNVSVWAPKNDKKWSWVPFRKRPDALILDNVSGHVRNGVLVAVLGPSGSGKTTLLSVLSRRNRLPSSGTVSLDGVAAEATLGKAQRPLGVFVPQHDVFFTTLTVGEHLYFLTEMKLHNQVTKEVKIEKLARLTQDLKLNDHIHKRIESLSGGEKKALSMAAALISDPQVLFCDEPTTGLDMYNALLVVDLLRHLAAKGKMVICSIHQPSSQIFNHFNEVMLVADGNMVFHGSLKKCLKFYESCDLRCPITYNPAEFYVKHLDRRDVVVLLTEKFKTSKYLKQITNKHDWDSNNVGITSICDDRILAPWYTQFRLLLWRVHTFTNRQIGLQLLSMIFSLVAAGMVCVSCWGITGTTQSGIQDMNGLLWLLLSEVSFTSAWSVIDDFTYEMPIYKRESELYSASAYYLAKFVNMIPRFVIFPYLYLAIIYLGVRFPSPITTYLWIGLIVTVTSVASGSYGLMLSAQFASTGFISEIIIPIDLVALLLSGVFVNLRSLPLWLDILKYASHFFYGMEAMFVMYWRQIDNIDCPKNKDLPCVISGEEVLSMRGYNPNGLVWDFVGLFIITFVMILVGIWSLKRQGQTDVAY